MKYIFDLTKTESSFEEIIPFTLADLIISIIIIIIIELLEDFSENSKMLYK